MRDRYRPSVCKYRIRAAFWVFSAFTTATQKLFAPFWRCIFNNRHFKTVTQILYSRPPKLPNLLIFAHYATNPTVTNYVLFYLEQLARSGFDVIFCSTAPSLSDDSVEKLCQNCMRVIIRQNRGYDFGSYFVGWQSVSETDLSFYKNVAFANDSVYGPIGSLDRFCRFINENDCDMVGLIDSFQFCYHLQSWFLVFSNNERSMQFLRWFWSRFKFYNSRSIAIAFYEIGMTQLAIEWGLKVRAFAPYGQVRRAAEARTEELGYIARTLYRNINPAQYYWRILIEDFSVPFVKRELVLKNPKKIPDVYKLTELAAARNYDIGMLPRHVDINKK